jgi:hypothetical protein
MSTTERPSLLSPARGSIFLTRQASNESLTSDDPQRTVRPSLSPSFRSMRMNKLTRALIFSWNEFLCPSTYIRKLEQTNLLDPSAFDNVSARLDRQIVSVLTQAQHLGHVYVLVEDVAPSFERLCHTFFPRVLCLKQQRSIRFLCADEPYTADTYGHMVYSICSKSSRLKDANGISLTVFGHESLRLACLHLANSFPHVLPKVIRATRKEPNFQQVSADLIALRERLESIITSPKAVDMPVRPVARRSLSPPQHQHQQQQQQQLHSHQSYGVSQRFSISV